MGVGFLGVFLFCFLFGNFFVVFIFAFFKTVVKKKKDSAFPRLYVHT